MLRSTQRILTTHTGSLPRPEGLTRLYIDHGQGKRVDSEELAGEAGGPPAPAFDGKPTLGSMSATTASSRETRSSSICVIG